MTTHSFRETAAFVCGNRRHCYVFYHECRLLDLEDMVQIADGYLLFPSGACFDTGRRNGAERFKKLDRSRSIQHTAFRVYEACDDCIPC